MLFSYIKWFSDDLTGMQVLFQISQDFGIISCSLLVVVFTYLYYNTVNPNRCGRYERSGGFIPGIKPGKTRIDNIMSRILLPGSLYLGVMAILPGIALNLKPDMTPQFLVFGGHLVNYGWSSIGYSSALMLLMRHYDGLMEKGKIKGKSSEVDVMIHYRSEDEIDLIRESFTVTFNNEISAR